MSSQRPPLKEIVIKGILAAATIALIVFILPKEAKFKYEFLRGKPWLHETLFAPFDFAIYKADEELAREEKEVREAAKPYFRYDKAVAETQLKKFEETFEEEWKNSSFGGGGGLFGMFGKKLPEAEVERAKGVHRQAGEAILKSIFQRGIVKVDDVIEGKPDDYAIVVLTDNVAEDRDLASLYRVQSAYDYMVERLEVYQGIDKEFLTGLLEDLLTHNVFYDESTTQKIISEQVGAISLTRGKVQKDETIIARGDIVTEELYLELQSLKREYEKQLGGSEKYYFILAGQIVLVTIAVSLLMFFLFIFRKDIGLEGQKVTFILIMLTLMVYMASIAHTVDEINIYVLPFCILPIILRTFYDTRLATFTNTVAILLCSFFAPNAFNFIFIQLMAGIVAVFSIVSLRRRSQLFNTAFYVFLSYAVSYFGLAIIEEGDLASVNWLNFAWFGGSAALTLIAYPIMYGFEKLFGFLSDVTLMELSDTNNPLLRELAEKAPGTLQHSLQVANLAEDAIRQLGGDVLLVRTGALYHDIGKMQQPEFFIENQMGSNPHDNLSPEESARIIIAHVTEGEEMARKANLPKPIIEFIRTHHGTTATGYFIHAWKEQNPGQQADETTFRYPGPVPATREQAVLMMADAVEAASRSLPEKNADTLGELVDKIIRSQLKEKQFRDAPITFRDLNDIRAIFKKKLLNIYHVRVEYPEDNVE